MDIIQFQVFIFFTEREVLASRKFFLFQAFSQTSMRKAFFTTYLTHIVNGATYTMLETRIISSSLSVRVVLKRTVVGDSRFDNPCGSHLQ